MKRTEEAWKREGVHQRRGGELEGSHLTEWQKRWNWCLQLMDDSVTAFMSAASRTTKS